MKLSDLKERLQKENIRDDVYSLYGADYDERLVLAQIGNGKWLIYYFERGQKTGLKEYTTENEACEAFLKIMINDPLAKI